MAHGYLLNKLQALVRLDTSGHKLRNMLLLVWSQTLNARADLVVPAADTQLATKAVAG